MPRPGAYAEHQPAGRRAGLHLGGRRHLHRLGGDLPVPDLHDLVHAPAAQDRGRAGGGCGRGALRATGRGLAAPFFWRSAIAFVQLQHALDLLQQLPAGALDRGQVLALAIQVGRPSPGAAAARSPAPRSAACAGRGSRWPAPPAWRGCGLLAVQVEAALPGRWRSVTSVSVPTTRSAWPDSSRATTRPRDSTTRYCPSAARSRNSFS